MNFKPLLGIEVNYDLIQYPVLASKKLDGIRAIFKDGEMLSRSLKPIRNFQLHMRFKGLIDYTKKYNIIFDGELYSHKLTFQEITSQVMSMNKLIDQTLKFHCFDCIIKENQNMSFSERYKEIQLLYKHPFIEIVEQILVHNKEDIDKTFEIALANGYEGLILRNLKGKYKFGRSTEHEGLLLKVKPFQTFDAKIIGVEERMENLNESEINELGQSFKRNTIDAKKGTGIASALIINYKGKEMKVTITGDEAFRRYIFIHKREHIGQWIEFKAMLIGAKDVPRHPIFLRFRDSKD